MKSMYWFLSVCCVYQIIIIMIQTLVVLHNTQCNRQLHLSSTFFVVTALLMLSGSSLLFFFNFLSV